MAAAVRENKKNIKLVKKDNGEMDRMRKRIFFISFIPIIFFALIITRLWFLQIQEVDTYRQKAENNRIRTIKIAAPRGNIVDREGKPVVSNRPSYNVVLAREGNKVDENLIKKVASLLNLDINLLLEQERKAARESAHMPITLAEDIGWDGVVTIENNRMDLPGVRIEVIPRRIYHYGNTASHLIGYLGKINKKELAQAEKGVYGNNDLIGKMGLEKLREKELRGQRGTRFMEVNSQGFEQKILKEKDPIPGDDLQLTIDMDLQKAAEEAMKDKDGTPLSGAVVALEVNSGKMLALVSSPELEIEKFIGGISYKDWQEILNNPYLPLVNKLVNAQYAPASTYKIVVALAGLAENIITKDTEFYCPGHYRIGNRTVYCWKRRGHGKVNLKRALSESCDVYFYQVGQKLGVDRIAKYAKMFGLGQKTGIEMEHEKPGLVPTSDWKKRVKGVAWQKGETLSVAIGQGFNLVTPVQLAFMTAMVANGGTLYKPGIVNMVKKPDGEIIERFSPQIISHMSGQGYNLQLIRGGLLEAVNGKHGTGRRAILKDLDIKVAGKTGTAQVVKLKHVKHLKDKDIPYKYRDHAWFTCYAPADKPEIVVTVLVEHGQHGGSAAAPVAQKVLEAYFNKKLHKSGDVNVAF